MRKFLDKCFSFTTKVSGIILFKARLARGAGQAL